MLYAAVEINSTSIPEPGFVNVLTSTDNLRTPGGIDSLELVPEVLKHLQIRARQANISKDTVRKVGGWRIKLF
jgi:hypothetical protein